MIELVGLGECTCYDEELKRPTRSTQKLIFPRRGHGLSSLGVAGAASALTLTAQVLHISPWGKSLDHISTWGKSTTTFPGGKSPPHVPLGENPRPHFQGKVSTTCSQAWRSSGDMWRSTSPRGTEAPLTGATSCFVQVSFSLPRTNIDS